MPSTLTLGLAVALGARLASAHLAFYDPSMWGYNVTGATFPYDNRPVAPLAGLSFKQWWFHDHLAYPPNAGDFFELPAGGTAHAQIACNKGATDWYATSDGGDIRQGNWPCPGQPASAFHALDVTQTGGSAIAITYNSDVNSVKPEDFAVISVNQTSPWYRYTDFQIPAELPACPAEGCICAWFWIHLPNSGAEQMYMNGFRCKVTGATGTRAIGKALPARRCGPDPDFGRPEGTPSNCTMGPQQPNYWYQLEGNNQFEDTYHPPVYKDLYNFNDGAQRNLFVNGASIPPATSAPASSSSSSAAAPSSSSSPVAAPSSSSSPVAASPSSSPAAAAPSPTPDAGAGASSSASALPTADPSPAASPPPANTFPAVPEPTTTSAAAGQPAAPSSAPAPDAPASSPAAVPTSSLIAPASSPAAATPDVPASSPATTPAVPASSPAATPAVPASSPAATPAVPASSPALELNPSSSPGATTRATASSASSAAAATGTRRCKHRKPPRPLGSHRRSRRARPHSAL